MKNSVSVAMAAYLAQEVTTLAFLWKVIRQDGEVFGFTSHDTDITYLGLTYKADTGFMPSATNTSSGLAVDDAEISGALSSLAIDQAEILAGTWDASEVWLYQVNYEDLTAGAIIVRRGWTGEIKSGKTSFTSELRGLTQKLAQQIGENYSPSCRATFGDARCKKDLNAFKVTGSITSITNLHEFADTARVEASNYFDQGLITFTTGLNAGLSREVKTFAATIIFCELPFPYAIEIDDEYEMWKGCDKTFATCKNTYNNIVNFRGEPYIPIGDTLIQGP
jgi:uncharacterized phage protein (TIGR02218 family)